MSNPEDHPEENPLMNLIHKNSNLNQTEPNFNQININNSNNPLENVPNQNQKNLENYEELMSKFSKMGLDDTSNPKNSSFKKQEQYNFFQNPNMINNNKNNQKEMDAFNYFFGGGVRGSDLSKKLGFNDIDINNVLNNNEENTEEKDNEPKLNANINFNHISKSWIHIHIIIYIHIIIHLHH